MWMMTCVFLCKDMTGDKCCGDSLLHFLPEHPFLVDFQTFFELIVQETSCHIYVIFNISRKNSFVFVTFFNLNITTKIIFFNIYHLL